MNPTYTQKLRQMDKAASSNNWDEALNIAEYLHSRKVPNAIEQLIGTETIPPSHLDKLLQIVEKYPHDKENIIFELAGNLHPDATNAQLHKIHSLSPDFYVTENVTQHPNFSADPEKVKAAEFWNSYEAEVEPSHFAAIKTFMSGEPSTIQTHRDGEGSSEEHQDQIPHLFQHMVASQNAILNDPNIKKYYVNGEPHIKVYRGVGGEYAKKIKDTANIQGNTIERHKTINIPSAHMSSWSLNKDMARRFATGRGGHNLTGEFHHIVLKKLVPVSHVLHSGMHSLFPGHFPVHTDEDEIVVSHPESKYKVSTKDIEVGHSNKNVWDVNWTPVEKTNPLKKSEDKTRVASIVVCSGDKMLMLQRRDNDKWTFPGGHLNNGESFIDGAVRELFEEAGIKASPDELILLGDKQTFQGKTIHVYLYKVNGEVATTASNDPDKEAKQFKWLPHILPEEIKENLYIPVGDNASLSMFMKYLLSQKVQELKSKLKKD